MSDAFSRPRVNTLPPQHMATVCGVMIPGGMMSYRCALAMGHGSVPAEDPEPHFTPEVSRSVISWQEWKYRQEHPETAPSQPFVATAKGGSLTEAGTDAGVVVPHPALDDTAFDPDAHVDNGEPEPTTYDPRLSVCQDPTCTATVVHGHGDGGWMVTPRIPAEALRTRDGDQVLPDGDESIPDDQQLLIDDIEARRRIGIQRYGQGHRPFNGRDTLRDWFEEQLDGLVYARSILRMSEAAREDLIREVDGVLLQISDSSDPRQALIASVSEKVVNRIMGWVNAQIIGNTIGMSDEVLESLILDGLHEGVHGGSTLGETANHIVAKIRAERDA